MKATYTEAVSTSHPLAAKLLALLKRVSISKTMGVTKLSIEGDCLILVENLNNTTPFQWEFMHQRKELLDLLSKFEVWDINFYRRLENRVADSLAKMVYRLILSSQSFKVSTKATAFSYHRATP